MSRSGYVDDLDVGQFNLWRGAVLRAVRGKRGQRAVRDLIEALDAMPEKRLAADLFDAEGSHCALGAIAAHRRVDLEHIQDPFAHPGDLYDCRDEIADALDIAPALAAEVMFLNDERGHDSDEDRWRYMRRWAERQLSEVAR